MKRYYRQFDLHLVRRVWANLPPCIYGEQKAHLSIGPAEVALLHSA